MQADTKVDIYEDFKMEEGTLIVTNQGMDEPLL